MARKSLGVASSAATDVPTRSEVQALIAAAGGGGSSIAYAPQKPFSGMYLAALGMQVTTGNIPGGQIRGVAVDISAAITADRIGIEITGTGAAGETCRLGIYNNNPANGRPTSLLLDAGTVAVDTLGFKEIAINQALSAGRYWLVGMNSTNFGTRVQYGVHGIQAIAQSDLTEAKSAITLGGFAIGAAFPSTLTGYSTRDTAHRVYLRCA